MAVLTVFICAVIYGLSFLVTDEALAQLKHNLSLWSIIALVVIINLVSFLCFLFFFYAYRWIRRDLKTKKQDILDE